ncbi:hypothetical protein GCK32_006073 [Trichostrongylus colubriformis]|uniref:Uncharacterized protein n=1 Tax=Trichostrongylus colubriformis TaxID=6319 RepID=A0AAN8FDM8_TRICO
MKDVDLLIMNLSDGRRMIDGKIEDVDSGTAERLWEQTLRRGTIKHKLTANDGDKEQQKDKDNEGKKVCDQAVNIVENLTVAAVHKGLSQSSCDV